MDTNAYILQTHSLSPRRRRLKSQSCRSFDSILLPIPIPRLLDTMEVRLANLERVMGALDGRVASLERLEVEDNGANRRSKQTDHQIHLTSGSLDLETNGASPTDAPDPTDGIGSMTFVKEEESGFFGTAFPPMSAHYADQSSKVHLLI